LSDSSSTDLREPHASDWPPVQPESANPVLYEINTRVLLGGIARRFNRPATFDDIPDQALRAVADLGFEWVWFLGVWQTGEAGRAISRSYARWREGFREAVPDLTESDICGSPFAVAGYQAEAAFGGNEALARLHRRVNAAGLRLMLDFVPNHLAPDHSWVHNRPSLFVQGSQAELDSDPQNWIRVETAEGWRILAHGRDPYFPGWPDTVQLDYANPETQAAMTNVLLDIAGRCDGLRCDMAMLLLPEVFEHCWSGTLRGRRVNPFWTEAIGRLRAAYPRFRLLAEVYWDLESRLIDQGFDWAYDKSLYDALRMSDAGRVRDLFFADLPYQSHLARFLENHDEPRAAATFDLPQHKAAAVLTFCAPGLRFIHQGQLEGARVHIPVHLDRGPAEGIDPGIHEFYLDLLAVLRDPVLHGGVFEALPVGPAWEGNPSHEAFTASIWSDADGPRLLCVVNYRSDRGQCRVRLTHPSLAGRLVSLSDRLGPEHYARDGDMLGGEGLYLDLPGWGYNLFALG
jgi:alpha amylase-like protein